MVPEAAAAVFAATEIARRDSSLLGELRKETSHLDPRHYRGIGRYPLQPFWTDDLDTVAADGGDIEADQAARLRFLEIANEEVADDDRDQVLPSRGLAFEVWRLLDRPDDWGGPLGRSVRFRTRRTLGI